MKHRIFSSALLATVLLLGCSSHKPAGSASSSDHNTITRQQLLDNHFHSAYEAVSALHSTWLQTRGTDSFYTPGEVKVIFDSSEMGGVDALKSISTLNVEYIRWYDGSSANTRWGVGHQQGVIFVSSHAE